MQNYFLFFNRNLIITIVLLSIVNISCRKFVENPDIRTDISTSSVFTTSELAVAALSGIYAQFQSRYASGDINSISYLSGLSSDELILYSTSQNNIDFFSNELTPSNSLLTTSLWSAPYKTIYSANLFLEGLDKSSKLPVELKSQLKGEALFIRAFVYFYLVNLFGDVPLVLTTDYRINAKMPRTATIEIYHQIGKDLEDASKILSSDYSYSNNERIRANKWAAIALMARVHLFLNDFEKAEELSTQIIDKISLYRLVDVDAVFKKNSMESIFQVGRDDGNAKDAITFTIVSNPTNAALRPSLVDAFDTSDLRRTNWIGFKKVGQNTYYFPTKYKVTNISPITEYTTVLRLAEQYLIRAEARINLPGKINEGIKDLNMIRARASKQVHTLPPIPESISQEEAMLALEMEKQFEFFTEWGHRWIDLKRWPGNITPGNTNINRADDILGALKDGWKREWKFYPIPQSQIANNPGMADQQNPGYD